MWGKGFRGLGMRGMLGGGWGGAGGGGGYLARMKGDTEQ